MLHKYIRVIGKKGAVYTDLSIDNADDLTSLVFDYDAIYIGKQFAFNNLHFWVKTPNATLEKMIVSLWDGQEWKPCEDLLDATKSLSKSGVVQFVPPENDNFHMDDTDEITDLKDSNIIIRNLYWIKITFENPIDIATELFGIAYNFTASQYLKTIDSDIDSYLAPLNYTDWTAKMIMASLQLALDMKKRGLINDEGQIIQFDDFAMAAAYKTISLIYFELGSDFDAKRKEVNKDYEGSLKTRRLTIDTDNDGKVDRSEMRNTIRTLTR